MVPIPMPNMTLPAKAIAAKTCRPSPFRCDRAGNDRAHIGHSPCATTSIRNNRDSDGSRPATCRGDRASNGHTPIRRTNSACPLVVSSTPPPSNRSRVVHPSATGSLIDHVLAISARVSLYPALARSNGCPIPGDCVIALAAPVAPMTNSAVSTAWPIHAPYSNCLSPWITRIGVVARSSSIHPCPRSPLPDHAGGTM